MSFQLAEKKIFELYEEMEEHKADRQQKQKRLDELELQWNALQSEIQVIDKVGFIFLREEELIYIIIIQVMDSKRKKIKVLKKLIDPSEYAFQDNLEATVGTFGLASILRSDGRIREREAFLEQTARRFKLTANTIDRNFMYFILKNGCKYSISMIQKNNFNILIIDSLS